MDNLINETNQRLQDIIDNLTTIKKEYENKLSSSNKEIEVELGKVKKYKEDFFVAKQKIEKMNSDIEGFEADYQNLVDRFKDDELANILIAANKEISAKIDERKRKIAKDKIAMNELVEKAELSKDKLVKLTAEKRALELCLAKILDSYEFYTKSLTQIIDYSNDNAGNLAACFHEQSDSIKLNFKKSDNEEDLTSEKIEDALREEYIIEDNDLNEEIDNTDEEVVIEDEEVIENNDDSNSDNDVTDSTAFEDDLDDEEIEAEEIKLDEDDLKSDEEDKLESKEKEEKTEKKTNKKSGRKSNKKIDEQVEENEENLVEETIQDETIETKMLSDEIPSVLYDLDDSIEEDEEDEKKD